MAKSESKDKVTLIYPQREPTEEERIRAANVALREEEQRRRRNNEEKIGNRKAYRNYVARKYIKRENWLECYEKIDMVTDPSMPEEEEEEKEEEKDPDAGKVMLLAKDGTVYWMTKAQHQSALYDFTGEIGDDDREVRHPLEWLKLKHPNSYEKLLDLVETGKFSINKMLKAAENITRKRFRGVLSNNPDKWKTNTIVKIERQSDFLMCVNETWRVERLKAKHAGQSWPPQRKKG